MNPRWRIHRQEILSWGFLYNRRKDMQGQQEDYKKPNMPPPRTGCLLCLLILEITGQCLGKMHLSLTELKATWKCHSFAQRNDYVISDQVGVSSFPVDKGLIWWPEISQLFCTDVYVYIVGYKHVLLLMHLSGCIQTVNNGYLSHREDKIYILDCHAY